MKPFTQEEHRDALIRRRIIFAVKFPSMARLIRRDTHDLLVAELVRRLQPASIVRIQMREEYDQWLSALVEEDGWGQFFRAGIKEVRWGHFAKLVNIAIYEIALCHELVAEADWLRIRWFLHVPIDSNVTFYLQQLEPTFPVRYYLKGMTREQYCLIQEAARKLAEEYGVPPIWFEAAWSAPKPKESSYERADEV